MKKKNVLLLLIQLSVSINLISQNCNCSELLQYGLYNHFNKTVKVDDYSKLNNEIYNSSKKESSESMDASASYKVFSASYGETEYDLLQKISSGSNLSVKDRSHLENVSTKMVSTEMMSAYKECLRLCQDSGLKFSSSFPSDSRFKSLSFNLEYNPKPGVTRQPIIKEIYIIPEGCYECQGDIVDLKESGNYVENHTTYKLLCQRKIEKAAFKLDGTDDKFVYAEEALISIQSDMGDYQIRIPMLEANTSEFSKGIGEIVASLMTEEVFIATHGNDWVLANGSPAPSGSEYKKYIDKYLPHLKSKLPDLRGVFLRGKNHNRPNGGNEDGDLSLGTYQVDELKSHNHPFKDKHAHDDKWAYEKNTGKNHFDADLTTSNSKTSDFGGKETRPRNVTVNYFIKIN